MLREGPSCYYPRQDCAPRMLTDAISVEEEGVDSLVPWCRRSLARSARHLR